MDQHLPGRRDFLVTLTALGAVGFPLLASRAGAATAYDPAARFEITVADVEFRRNAAGRRLMARVYQPKGAGPFPVILDLHGGAWNAKDRHAEEPMDRALAASGLLVVAIDMTLAPEAPYPACVQDANYAVRWLKTKAASWNGDGSRIGIYGSSSGGHVAELLAMRPRDPRYNAIALPGAPNVDATVAFVAMRSPVSNPFARFQNAENLKRDAMMRNTTTFFRPWETIHESNPQEILERHETVSMVPLLIMQGALDDNVLPAVQERFAATYKAAGGDCQVQVFEGCQHEWVATPGPQTDRARDMVKAFIARQLKADARPATRMRGVFIILTTPFTASGEVDWDDLAREALFVDRCGCQGIVWPQGSSGVANLTKAERMRGMDVLAAAARGKRVALVLGVQGKDTAEMLEYAQRAEALAPDALIAMPPSAAHSLDEYREYFRALAKITSRPVIVQTSGGARDLPPAVDLIVELAREFPHMAYVKEESAPLVERMKAELEQRPTMKGVFGASLGAGWLYEMRLGLDGVITGMAMYPDLMARIWALHEHGDTDAVRDAYARFLLMRNVSQQIPGADLYLLKKRGVFKTTAARTGGAAAWKVRTIELSADEAAEVDYRFAALQPYLQTPG